MMKIRLTLMAIFLVTLQASASAQSKDTVDESGTPPAVVNPIDRIVFTRLSSLGMRPVLCSDAVFLRRATST